MIDRRDFLQLAVLLAGGLLSSTVQAAPIRRLVFIHGRSQQGLDPLALKGDWTKAVAETLLKKSLALPDDLAIEFPFYGDRLDEFVRQSNLPLTADIQSRGDQTQDEYLVFQAQVAEAMREPAGVTDAQVDEEYGDNPKQRGPLNWEWVQAILRAVDKHGGGLTRGGIESFTRDVFLYLTSDVVREGVNSIVADTFTDEPTIVVAHSLGTVVAYNILTQPPKPLNVPLLITMGSPLGIRAIRDPMRPLKFPAPVKAWFNAYDTRDVVALYPLDSANFAVQPPIENFSGVKNATSDRHGAVGYLADTTVADRIFGGLG